MKTRQLGSRQLVAVVVVLFGMNVGVVATSDASPIPTRTLNISRGSAEYQFEKLTDVTTKFSPVSLRNGVPVVSAVDTPIATSVYLMGASGHLSKITYTTYFHTQALAVKYQIRIDATICGLFGSIAAEHWCSEQLAFVRHTSGPSSRSSHSMFKRTKTSPSIVFTVSAARQNGALPPIATISLLPSA